ncbi:hydroxymethylglutaryl-CoA lyase [Ectobacillus ponti]|uniref:Hydroxymethylglutaryl-CoA lyase n=1 Tax=Ectobacillus ponti TaxID=2961894 RepID=A0AA41X8Y1_9BACI|nr:hydroxymethylglutaryl-CoA lyase [Ectobacillus ponti]MCP8971076.1 hydroxymethylglutaryl-CoA lyase [Ectobacillus ponti]
MKLPKRVEVIEVGPRDGLQNEPGFIPTEQKIALIHALGKAGIRRMEATSFVHPVYVPQMRDAAEVLQGIGQREDVQYMVLIPNEKGYERAEANGVRAVSFVTGASDTFNQRNVKMGREDSLSRMAAVIARAKAAGMFIRYNIATAFWCPYEGRVDPAVVLDMAERLDRLDVDEIVLCDTIGRANPQQVHDLFGRCFGLQPHALLTAHFHDTYGTAQANIIAALQAGVTRFDTSIGGLGGCPFAPGAAGNAATEDVVFMLGEMGVETGIDLPALLSCVELIKPCASRELTGHVHKV